MKKISKFINIPSSLFDTPDLSITAKWVLVSIDSVWDGNQRGINIGIQSIASMCNLKQKEVKEALNELYEHGALTVTIVDGDKFMKPLLYRESYPKTGERVVVGDKPTDTEQLNWDEIQQEWSAQCPMLNPISRWTPGRKAKVRSALKNASLSIQDMYKCFQIIGSTSFLNGSTGQFRAEFDWVVSKSQNLSKIYEGFYSKSYQERKDYEDIMNGKRTNVKPADDDLYR